MSNCIFCQIIAGEKPAQIYYHDEQVTAFQDIHPVAPTHILIVPNKHIASMNDLIAEDQSLMGQMMLAARQLAHERGIASAGYRLIINTGPHGGQVVYHLHLHLIGGQRMHFPMG